MHFAASEFGLIASMVLIALGFATLTLASADPGPGAATPLTMPRTDVPGSKPHEITLFDYLDASGNFRLFVRLLVAASLDEVLGEKWPGCHTLFAPTDAAFRSVPRRSLEWLLLPENRSQLRLLLENHILPGMFMLKELTLCGGRDSLAGSLLEVNAADSGFMVNGVPVARADIMCKTGIINEIPAVLVPARKEPEEEIPARGGTSTIEKLAS